MMMHPYFHELPTKTIQSITFYTPPIVHENESIIFQMIQTGIINSKTTQTIEHEFFKIHPYPFALQHFDSLKNIYLDEQGWVLDHLPNQKTTNTTDTNNNLIQKNDTLPQEIQSKKVAEAYDEIPSLKAFIAYKLANGNQGMEKYYLEKNTEQFNTVYLYEYLDTYNSIDSAKLEFDLDDDRDMDYCVIYSKPKRHIEFYVFDNVLRQFILDTMMSKAPYLYLNLKERKLVKADYPIQQMFEMNVKETYIRWNNNWQLIEWELQDYLSPHNNDNEATRRRLNDTLCTYDYRTKTYIQHADYNFDGRIDSRIAYDTNVFFHNTSYYCDKFDYFIYDNEKGKAIKDELLSTGSFTFDFNNKTAIGYVTKRNYTNRNIWQSITDKYEWIENKFVKTEITEQIQACHFCERIITITSRLIEGKWQQVDYDPGAE
jgi:hypothetical protein